LSAPIGCGSDDAQAPAPGAAPPSGESAYAAAVTEFVKAYNAHDTERALSFFAEGAVANINAARLVLQGRDAMRAFLIEYGAATAGSALSGAFMIKDNAHSTGDGYYFSGRISYTGRQTLAGFAPTGLTIPIDFAFVCQFDGDNHCTSCNAILNWGALLPAPVS
jgi:ketosteroid isomerase-like protein